MTSFVQLEAAAWNKLRNQMPDHVVAEIKEAVAEFRGVLRPLSVLCEVEARINLWLFGEFDCDVGTFLDYHPAIQKVIDDKAGDFIPLWPCATHRDGRVIVDFIEGDRLSLSMDEARQLATSLRRRVGRARSRRLPGDSEIVAAIRVGDELASEDDASRLAQEIRDLYDAEQSRTSVNWSREGR